MRTRVPVSAIAAWAAVWCLATPSTVYASYTSTISATTATMTGTVAGDTLVITEEGGFFKHNRFTAGDADFSSDFDFNSAVGGEQTLVSSGTINIDAGDGDDTILLGGTVNIKGTVNGGIGNDTISYTGYNEQVGVNLGLGTTGMNATLGGDQEVPATSHAGTGTATISNYNIAARTFDIAVTVSNLPAADVTGFHIHYGWSGVPGLIIVDFSSGPPLVPSGSGFTFNATGLVVPAAFEAGFLGGATYLNVHTAAFPNGAIRGQIFSQANALSSTGRGNGVGSLTAIEHAIGSSSFDSLVGSFAINSLSGGPGLDQILGGPANDTLSGNDDEDLLIWSNGDGSDVMEGGAASDVVLVNGNPTGNDTFNVGPNGTRLDFDRVVTGAFSLDIGTSETLIVNGLGGNEIITVNDLAGVNDVTSIQLFGQDGTDTFCFTAASNGGRNYAVHGGAGNDTVQGSNFGHTFGFTLLGQGGVSSLAQFRFVEGVTGGSGDDTFHVKAFPTLAPLVTGGGGNDTLNYDAEGRTVSGDTTPPDGNIASPGVQSVLFFQCETVNLNNVGNFQPTISAISSLTIPANTNTGVLAFTVGDVETPADNLVVIGVSGNTTLVPVANIVFGGGGANRTVTVTPAPNQVGSVIITLTVTDAGGSSANSSFEVTVTAPTTLQPPLNFYVSDISGGNVTFRFTPPALGPAPTGFLIEGGVLSGQVLASIPTPGGFPIVTVQVPPGSFYARAHSVNGSERSASSNEIRLHVNVPVAPSAPDMLSAAVNGNILDLRWRNTFGGGAPTGVVLEASGPATAQIPLGPGESFSTTGAPNGTWTLRIRDTNAGGTSPLSAPVTVTFPSPCGTAPQVPSNFLAYRVGNTGYVVWDPPLAGSAAAFFVLDVTGSFVGQFTTPGRALSGQIGPGSYVVRVRASNSCGNSPFTATQTITVP